MRYFEIIGEDIASMVGAVVRQANHATSVAAQTYQSKMQRSAEKEAKARNKPPSPSRQKSIQSAQGDRQQAATTYRNSLTRANDRVREAGRASSEAGPNL